MVEKRQEQDDYSWAGIIHTLPTYIHINASDNTEDLCRVVMWALCLQIVYHNIAPHTEGRTSINDLIENISIVENGQDSLMVSYY